MKFHPLNKEQKEYLKLRHRYEGDKRVADRIKAVLLKNEGWKNKPIGQTASRTRVNVMGAIELTSMNVVTCRPDHVNAHTTVAFFDQLKAAYPIAPRIHIILVQSGYHRSVLVQEEVLKRNIVLHYLPPL
jgi:hypothetical protein